ncbi:RsmD family RNA methyltransferase [Winogradskyella sp.]|uniref:THUMP-like domain-containing protein n=1 Tax=Winogradskyella sp. TaxID=1883156 RepID=UPI001B163227|nr:RsmD family RNA methyltransferase [Winogradskyella sp.]MBO6881804.1 RsmD family RNA methyltransferase [Winogradskyella sp.]
MNKAILNIEVQEFINSHINSDVSSLLLKGLPFEGIDAKLIIEQIEAKKRSEKKLPTWFKAENIYFPNKLNIEQTSSEITAQYKADLVSGKKLIDLTGGFGVDTYYFSKQVEKVIHCELNTELSDIVAHNYRKLQVSNVECRNKNGIEILKKLDQQFDWIYIDPSRRDNSKNKVFLITDCSPNVKSFQSLFLKYAENVMIKTSPLLDISATLIDLENVKQIHVVAVNNEVKELLWILERNYSGSVLIKTINIQKDNQQTFDFYYDEESTAKADYSIPLNFLYEPNSAILKAGAFNSVSSNLGVKKLHKHSHLYTSETLIDFPGRRFNIENVVPFNKKAFSKLKIQKANITTRNFPLSVADIRKKFKVKDGGTIYLFFTTNLEDEKIILICSKI